MNRIERQVADRRTDLQLEEVIGGESMAAVDLVAGVQRRLAGSQEDHESVGADGDAFVVPGSRVRWGVAAAATLLGVFAVTVALWSINDEADPAQNRRPRDSRTTAELVDALRKGEQGVTGELVRRGLPSVDALLVAFSRHPHVDRVVSERRKRAETLVERLRAELQVIAPAHPSYQVLREMLANAESALEKERALVGGGWQRSGLATIRRIGPAASARIEALHAVRRHLPAWTLADWLRTLGDLAPYSKDYEFEGGEPRGRSAELHLDRLRTRCRLRGRVRIEEIGRCLRSRDLISFEWGLEQLRHHGAAGRPFARIVARAVQGEIPEGPKELRRLIPPVAARAMLVVGDSKERSVMMAHEYLLSHGEEPEQIAAIQAIRTHSAYTEGTLRTLQDLARTASPLIVREAIVTFGLVGPPAAAAIPLLEKIASGENRSLQAVARVALKRIRGA